MFIHRQLGGVYHRAGMTILTMMLLFIIELFLRLCPQAALASRVDPKLHLHDVIYVQNDVHAGGSAHIEVAKSTADLYIRSLRSR